MRNRLNRYAFVLAFACGFVPVAGAQNIAIKGKSIHTMSGAPIDDGVIIIRDGKIAAVGPAASTPIPQGFAVREANVVTPGLIDAHGTVGVSGLYNSPHDQDQLDHTSPVQPELRAIDAYNPNDKLVEYVRSFGITTVHTGHAPGELISGQTCIVKTRGNTIDEAVIVPEAMVAVSLGEAGQRSDKSSPGTRGKEVAMLRAEFIRTQDYLQKRKNPDETKRPDRDLKLDMLARVLAGEVPLLITANRAQDIASALRLADEFKIRIVLDSASEAYLMIDEIKKAGVPVIVHPSMQRAVGETDNQSFETAANLHAAGVSIAMQSGYESYVPKTRVALFEAAITAANGLSFEEALATITRDAAKILNVDSRIGTIEVGKDGDLALFDGDPFEYTSHCTGTIIEGVVVSDQPR